MGIKTVDYRREKYSYTFDYGYDDKVITADTCYEGALNIPENVTRDGYIFAGWSLDGKNSVKVNSVMGKEDIVYHALWTPVTYTVYFDGNSKYLFFNSSFVKLPVNPNNFNASL